MASVGFGVAQPPVECDRNSFVRPREAGGEAALLRQPLDFGWKIGFTAFVQRQQW